METISVQAVYKKGVLKPRKKLNLPEDSVVDVLVKPIMHRKGKNATLFGAFPALANITEAEMKRSKRQWTHSLGKQGRILRGK